MPKISSVAIAAALVASAAATAVTTTLSPYDERVNLIELAVYVSDIGAHLAEYYAFQALHKTETYPPEVAKAVFAGGDFTTLLTGIAGDEVTRMITGVPWYSTRLRAAISEALENEGIATAIATSTSDASAASTESSSTSANSVETTASSAASSEATVSSATSSEATVSSAESTSVATSAVVSSSLNSTSSASISVTPIVQNGTDSTITKTQVSTVEATITSCSAGVCTTLTTPATTSASASTKAKSSAVTSVVSSASHVIDVSTNGANKFGNGAFGAAAIAGAAALLL